MKVNKNKVVGMSVEPFKEGYIQIVADEGKVLIYFPTMQTFKEAVIKEDDLNNWGEIDA